MPPLLWLGAWRAHAAWLQVLDPNIAFKPARDWGTLENEFEQQLTTVVIKIVRAAEALWGLWTSAWHDEGGGSRERWVSARADATQKTKAGITVPPGFPHRRWGYKLADPTAPVHVGGQALSHFSRYLDDDLVGTVDLGNPNLQARQHCSPQS